MHSLITLVHQGLQIDVLPEKDRESILESVFTATIEHLVAKGFETLGKEDKQKLETLSSGDGKNVEELIAFLREKLPAFEEEAGEVARHITKEMQEIFPIPPAPETKEERDAASRIAELLGRAVLARVADILPQDEQKELNGLFETHPEEAFVFLKTKIPNFPELLEEETTRLESELQKTSS